MYPGKWGVEVPNKPAAIHAASGEALTHGQLNERSNRLAQLLWARGLRWGDHVAIFMENSLRYFEVAWSALRSGLYLTTVNRHLTAEEALAGHSLENLADEPAPLYHSAPLAFCTATQALGGTVVMMHRFDEVGALRAVVQPVPDTPADDELAEELLAYAREHLAYHKCPRSIDFMEQLPRLPTSKLYKRLLKDCYWGRRGRGLFESCKASGGNPTAAKQRDAT